MNHLSKTLKFDFKIVSEKDTFGRLTQNRWGGVMDDVVNEKADLGLAGLEMTPNRLEAVEYSIPVMHNGIVAMHRRKLPNLVERSVFFCLVPFSPSVWICVIFVLLLTTALITVNATRNPRERAQRLARGELGLEPHSAGDEPMTLREHICQASWYVLSTAALQSAPRQPMSVTGRLLSLTWWIFAGLTLCAYLAALLMGIVVSRGFTSPSFSTISELAIQSSTQNYRVFFVPPRIGEMIFRDHADKNFQHLYALAKKSENYLATDASRGERDTTAWANTLLENSERNIVIISSESARSLFNHLDCGKVVATEFVDDRYMSLVFPRNATALRLAVNKELLKLQENGIMRLLIRKWGLQGSGKCSNDLDDVYWIYQQADRSENTIAAAEALATLFHDSVPIGLKTFSGILLFYFFGLFVTGGALAADLYIYSRIERHKVSQSHTFHVVGTRLICGVSLQ